jgi:hypothetical protein
MRKRYGFIVVGIIALAAGASPLRAGAINVPNGSFENPPLPAALFNQGGFIAAPMDAIIFTGVDPIWVTQGPITNGLMQDTGVFVNQPGPGFITNADGAQLAFMNVLSTDQVRVISQNLTNTYQVGQSYTLTVGVCSSSEQPPTHPGDGILVGLYYVDAGNNRVKIADLPVNVYALALSATPFQLQDFSVTVPTVGIGDAWAGMPIGIDFRSAGTGGGFADLDNVRLTAVPEPATLAMLGLAAPLLWARRRRR